MSNKSILNLKVPSNLIDGIGLCICDTRYMWCIVLLDFISFYLVLCCYMLSECIWVGINGYWERMLDFSFMYEKKLCHYELFVNYLYVHNLIIYVQTLSFPISFFSQMGAPFCLFRSHTSVFLWPALNTCNLSRWFRGKQ